MYNLQLPAFASFQFPLNDISIGTDI